MPNRPPHKDPEPLARGASIGRYIVLGLVGRGGMGEVYAAYDPELDRKVAVKLLRVKASNGLTMTEGRQRTLREAQAIARLSHPNVVTVFDVGTFNDQVFIAMEFVDGHTATYWIQSQPRTWQEILAVFIAAGQGLQAAHEKGLVHRDFKPDNVMVGKNGDVRVMDFGLARQIEGKPVVDKRAAQPVNHITARFGDAPIEAGTMVLNQAGSGGGGAAEDLVTSRSDLFDAHLTRTGAMMGTPAYMAPEQFFGTPTDARTDQFSFCVALYEALYGQRPFAGENMQGLTGNVVQGNIRPAPAKSKVPGWIRRILLRGLRPAAAERHKSMVELLEALGKNPYQTARKRAMTVSLLVLPLAFGFGVRQTMLARGPICDGGGDKLAGVWELQAPGEPEAPRRAQIHQAFLATGKSYAVDVFATVSGALTDYLQRWSAMHKEACEATQVRHEQSAEVLDLRMACLQERLNGVHALTDVFAGANGEVVDNAVNATNAIASLDRCADVPLLRALVRPPDDPKTRARVDELRRRLADLKARFDAGRWKEVLKEAPNLVSDARALGYQPLVAESLALIGNAETGAGDALAAERAMAEAYRLADASRHDEVRAEVATILVFVVGAQEARFEDARRWSETASAVLQRLGGHDLLQAWLLNDLGCAYSVHHDGDAALSSLKAASALKEKTLGPDHPDVGFSEGNIGNVLHQMGKDDEGLLHTDRALAILRTKLGSSHPSLAPVFSTRGEILNSLGRYQSAREAFDQAKNIWERELGPNATNLGDALTGIGVSYLAQGKATNALVPLERALKIREDGHANPADRAETAFVLARALWEAGRDRERARRLAGEAEAVYGKPGLANRMSEVAHWLRSHRSS